MTVIDHSLILFLAITLGILGQMVLSGLRRPGAGYRVGQIVLTLWWAGLGVALLIGGVMLFAQNAILLGVGNLALGVGLALVGIGYALELAALRGIGVVILAIGPIAIGIDAILHSQPIVGCIAIALGIGIPVSNLRGRVGALGQAIAGRARTSGSDRGTRRVRRADSSARVREILCSIADARLKVARFFVTQQLTW